MNARKQLWIAVVCMTFVVILGTLGFMTIEEISLFQAFWMTMITVLTVGYGDAVPVTHAGIHIAKGIANPLTVHYIDTVLYGVDQSFVIEEIAVGKGSILASKSLLESDVRNQFDVTILAILRNGNVIHNPTGQEKLQERDMIIVFGSVEKLGQFEKELQSKR
ncbi:TPA: cation:proton antiporter regulatory subunit [Bacillus cereus]